jgi:hypothetical protein
MAPELRNAAEQPDDATIDAIQAQAADALFESLRDPSSLSARRVLSQVFERELDELATPAGSSYFSDKPETSEERDKKKREEKHLLGAVGGHVARGLKEHGLRVKRVIADGETQGGGEYIVKADDAAGREYTARFGLDLAESLVASGGTSNLVERMGHAVVRRLLDERANYFRRAGL